MSVFKLDKLMGETRRLAAEYRRATGSTLPVSGEIARYDAMSLLGLQAPEQPLAGVDAVDGEGRRYQVKARTLFDAGKGKQRIGQVNTEGEWDRILLVVLNEAYETQAIHEAERGTVLEALAQVKANKRGALSVARFIALSRPVWPTPDADARKSA
ncbi:MAG: hypothetical protein HYV16_09820 [Gammaproteobacteria bacterium]|nr:hypothetical protein [Gammaproteobacteria bacterium]